MRNQENKSHEANISRSKNNHTMKFGHLIEYKKKNVFLKKLYQKEVRQTSSRSLFVFLNSFI